MSEFDIASELTRAAKSRDFDGSWGPSRGPISSDDRDVRRGEGER